MTLNVVVVLDDRKRLQQLRERLSLGRMLRRVFLADLEALLCLAFWADVVVTLTASTEQHVWLDAGSARPRPACIP